MKAIRFSLCAVVLFVLLGIAGRMDYNEQVLYTMSDATYKAIQTKLGERCTPSEVVEEYMQNRNYYDKVNN